MKVLYCTILFLLPLQAVSAQEDVELTLNDRGQYEYQAVFEAPASPDEIYDRALAWIALNYRSANDVIQLKDDQNDKIIAKGTFITTNLFSEVSIRHTLQIEARDGRYRVTYGPFVYQGGPTAPEFPFESRHITRRKRMREKTAKIISEALLSLHSAVQEESDEGW